jgi:hypothetical protein
LKGAYSDDLLLLEKRYRQKVVALKIAPPKNLKFERHPNLKRSLKI